MKPLTELRREAERVALQEMADAGMTQEEAAAALKITRSSVSRLAKLHGVRLPRKQQPVQPGAREHAMLASYRTGQTLQQIGDEHHITGERVRQLLSKHFGISSQDGGAAVVARRKARSVQVERDQRYMAKLGIPFVEWQRIRRMEDCPLRPFQQQMYNAKRRGIAWEMNFAEWWAIWRQSGKWPERGRGQGYVMCRFDNEGPYSPDNVFIAPAYESSSKTKNKKSDLPIGVHRVEKGNYVAFVAKRQVNGKTHNLGSFRTPEQAAEAYWACSP